VSILRTLYVLRIGNEIMGGRREMGPGVEDAPNRRDGRGGAGRMDDHNINHNLLEDSE
jgi:hypothetical protein